MENKPQTIEIRRLDATDATDLYNMIIDSGQDYYRYFTAFKINQEVISGFLSKAKKNQYLGFFIEKTLIGFFMLRGLDEGYQIPSYGVFISKKYQSVGLARISVIYSISFCKLNRIEKLMLKVHPSNTAALKLYRDLGFSEDHIDQSNNNLVFYKEIS